MEEDISEVSNLISRTFVTEGQVIKSSSSSVLTRVKLVIVALNKLSYSDR
jgi:hypothetical protein